MTCTEFSCEIFLAHRQPDELLLDHLRQVGSACKSRFLELGISDKFSEVASIVGKTHDFGKYSIYFQQKLISGYKSRNFELYSHAPLSAIYAAYSIYHLVSDPYYALMGAYCVWNHHQSLTEGLKDFVNLRLEKFRENPNYTKQLEALDKNHERINRELQILGLPSLESFLECVRGSAFDRMLSDMYRAINLNRKVSNLYELLLLFSVLIDCDKRFAGHIYQSERTDIDLVRITKYVANLGNIEKRIGLLRTRLRESVLGEFHRLLSEGSVPRIMYIHAPTGSGKTLLSFECALALRHELERKSNKKLRIIYVLPYINIIEQTYDVLRQAVTKDSQGNDELNLIMKHHHLYVPTEGLDSETPNEQKMLLVESWESEIIVTTFVQFMETLVGTRNKMLKKFNKLFDAIIILDEIQSTSPELWAFLVECLKELSERSYIIIMSATMPKLFTEQMYPLVKASRDYFTQTNRIRYEYIHDSMDLRTLSDFILEKWRSTSMLVVVNTIRASIELYNLLKQKLELQNAVSLDYNTDLDITDERPVLAYLSTNILPIDRLRRIRTIKEILGAKGKVILVSTQVIEAGIDLDFDIAIRDIAPLDCVIQTGGRCNRNWNVDKGTVYVVKLKDEQGRLYANYVYSPLSINKLTIPFFEKYHIIEERDLYNIVSKYYDEQVDLLSIREQQESIKYLEASQKLDFGRLSQFKVIKEEPKSAVFVDIDNGSRQRLESLRTLWNKRAEGYGDYAFRRLLEYEWIKAREYIIDTWYEKGLPNQELLPDSASSRGVKLIDREQVPLYYNLETGLKLEDRPDVIFI